MIDQEFKSSKWQIITKFALIYSLIAVGVGLLLYLFNMLVTGGWINGLVSLIALGGSLYFGMQSHREQNLGGYMSYGQALGIGSLISLVAGIILSVYQFVFNKYIAPELANNMMMEVKRGMIEEGRSEESIQAAMSMMESMQNPWIIIGGGIFGTFVLGFIISLITAAFTKKDDPNQAYNDLNT